MINSDAISVKDEALSRNISRLRYDVTNEDISLIKSSCNGSNLRRREREKENQVIEIFKVNIYIVTRYIYVCVWIIVFYTLLNVESYLGRNTRDAIEEYFSSRITDWCFHFLDCFFSLQMMKFKSGIYNFIILSFLIYLYIPTLELQKQLKKEKNRIIYI